MYNLIYEVPYIIKFKVRIKVHNLVDSVGSFA